MANSQVRMMSCAWGRMSMGNSLGQTGSSPTVPSSATRRQPPAICGLTEEVAQVSRTSGSPTKPPGAPRWDSSYPAGACEAGSTGRSDSAGVIGWS